VSGILTDLCYCVCVVCKQHAAESYKKGPVEVSFVQLSFVQSQNVAVKPATLVLQVHLLRNLEIDSGATKPSVST
jgi:hypothetical protein